MILISSAWYSNNLSSKLLSFVIIDELAMVSSDLWIDIDSRLGEI